jgi:hypothetical protein
MRSSARKVEQVTMESSEAPGRVDVSRRRFVKLTGGLVIGGAATSLLAACGGGTTAAPTAAPAAKPTEAPKPAAAAPPSSVVSARPSGSKMASLRYRPNSIPAFCSTVSAATAKPRFE